MNPPPRPLWELAQPFTGILMGTALGVALWAAIATAVLQFWNWQ